MDNTKESDTVASGSKSKKCSETDANAESKTDENESPGKYRSVRRKRPRQIFTPDEDLKMSRRKQKKPKHFPFSSTAHDRPCDLLPNGTRFSCDLCKSPYVINRFCKKALKNKRSKHVPVPKQRLDPVTQKMLQLCNACGSTFDRPKKQKPELMTASVQEKDKYVKEAKSWAKKLAEKFDLPNAIHLYCPVFKSRKCECLQNYIKWSADDTEKQRKVSQLSAMASEARRLSALKCYEMPGEDTDGSPQKKFTEQESPEKATAISNSGKKSDKTAEKKTKKAIGLGNGHKKSEKFTEFVLSKREHLKHGLHICERATQKILCYSNNFLHKRLKTEEKRFRAKPVKGKARLGLLPSFDDLAKKRCCVDNCVMMALTHRTLLEEWRKRARKGQVEARRVIAEMLTPSACARKNCYTFVTAVTGCSRTTVVQVNQQMLHTGGNREPPTHGLTKYHDKKKKGSSVPLTSEIQTTFLDKQREQLQQLQLQVSEQQLQLQQQQQLQQQLLKQTLLSQQREGQATQNVLFLQQFSNQLNMQIQNTQRGLQQTLHNMGLLMDTSDNQSHDQAESQTQNSGIVTAENNASEHKNKSGQPKRGQTSEELVQQTLLPPDQTGIQSLNQTGTIVGLYMTMLPHSNNLMTQQLIPPPPPLMQAPQQILQTAQPKFVTQQPNYQVSLIPSQSNQNVITIQPNVVMATPNQVSSDTQNQVYNLALPVQQVNNQPVIVLENIQGNLHGSKVADVLSNIQVVDMPLPSLDQVRSQGQGREHIVTTNKNLFLQQVATTPKDNSYIFTNESEHLTVTRSKKGQRSSLNGMSSKSRLDIQGNGGNEVANLTVSNQEPSPPNMTVITRAFDMQDSNRGRSNLIAQASDRDRLNVLTTSSKLPVSHLSAEKQSMYTAVPYGDNNLSNHSYNNSLLKNNKSDSKNVKSTKTKLSNEVIGTMQNSVKSKSSDENNTINTADKTRENIKNIPGTMALPTLTSEYMNFSLPLSEVISVYTEGQKNGPADQAQHLRLSLQINALDGNGHSAVGSTSNTLNLGSILIMDQEDTQQQNNLIPKTVLEQYEKSSKMSDSQRSRNDSEKQLFIDEGRISDKSKICYSSDDHLTDTDEEIQDILQTSKQATQSKNNQKDKGSTPIVRSDTLPFQPMERSDTLIIDQSMERSDTVKLTQDMDRSDTMKLPETENSETYVLPSEVTKIKRKVRKISGNKCRIRPEEISKNNQNKSADGSHVILTGNLNSTDQSWLQKLVHDIQKQK